jgi:hypothetical protein
MADATTEGDDADRRADEIVRIGDRHGTFAAGAAETRGAIAAAIREAVSAERERSCGKLRDVIQACRDALETGHVPSSFDPWARMQECKALLAIMRSEQ